MVGTINIHMGLWFINDLPENKISEEIKVDELISVMEEIRDLLTSIDEKLDDIRGSGINSIDDICGKLDDIRGIGINSLDDVCSKLDDIDMTINLK